MNKIKKKIHWAEHAPPRNTCGDEPQKEIRKQVEIKRFSLEDIRDINYSFLKDFDLGRVSSFISYYKDDDGEIVFQYNSFTIRDSITYEKEMKDYNKKIQKHEQDVKEWHLWKFQIEREQLKAKIDAAKDFLKEHGELK